MVVLRDNEKADKMELLLERNLLVEVLVNSWVGCLVYQSAYVLVACLALDSDH